MRALRDPRPLGLLAVSCILTAALLFTPLSGRAWLVLVWGVLVYAVAVAIRARRHGVPAPPRPAPAPIASTQVNSPPAEWPRLTEEALRKLNNPAALGQCALAAHLPLILESRAGRDGVPLRHQGLRAALVQAIERLKPAEADGAAEQSLYHDILHEEYVLGYPTARITTRHAISESTFHRYRRDAIRALAEDLAAQEAALARPRP